MSSLEDRKKAIVEVMREHGRPIWIGDISTSRSEEISNQAALEALIADGRIRQLPGGKRERAYYELLDFRRWPATRTPPSRRRLKGEVGNEEGSVKGRLALKGNEAAD